MASPPSWGFDYRFPSRAVFVVFSCMVTEWFLSAIADDAALRSLGPAPLVLGLLPLAIAVLVSPRVRWAVNFMEVSLVAGFAFSTLSDSLRFRHTLILAGWRDPKWHVLLACLDVGAYVSVLCGLLRNAADQTSRASLRPR